MAWLLPPIDEVHCRIWEIVGLAARQAGILELVIDLKIR